MRGPGDEISDLQQEIVLHLLGFEHDETLASEKTALHRIADRKLINARRGKKRRVRRLNHEAVSFEEAEPAKRTCRGMPDIEQCDLRLDLETVMADLPELQRAVCEGPCGQQQDRNRQ